MSNKKGRIEMKKNLFLISLIAISLFLHAEDESSKSITTQYSNGSVMLNTKVISFGDAKQKSERKKNYTAIKKDGAGRVIAVESKEQGSINYKYDDLGNLSEIDKNGIEKEIYGYDILGRKINIEYRGPMGNDKVEFEYSTAPESYLPGELQKKIEKNETSRYFYNKKKLIKESKTILGKEFNVGYRYNDKGLLSTIEYPSGLLVEYEYNGENQKQAIYATSGKERRLLYSQKDNEKEHIEVYGNGLKTTRIADPENLSMSIKNGELIDWVVRFDQEGMIASVIDKKKIRNKRDFYYDGDRRLRKAYGPWGICRYGYDEMDNLIYREEKGSKLELTYGEKDSRIKTLKINDVEVPVAYDKLGRMIQKGDMVFEYNERGRLFRIKKGEKILAELHYNWKNQRVMERVGNEIKVFVFDENDRLLGEYDKKGQRSREYIYWEEMPVAFIQDGKLFYYHYDPMNFPVLITGENGKKVRMVQYRPYGEITAIDGELDDTLRFPGQYEIKGTGLYYNINRTYDWSLGRYSEPDPIVTKENVFQYANNNPVEFIDVKGLFNYHGPIVVSSGSWLPLPLVKLKVVFINGHVESDCFTHSDLVGPHKIWGTFRSIMGGGSVEGDLPSVLTNGSVSIVGSIEDFIGPAPLPDIKKEFKGLSSFAGFGATIGVGWSLGRLDLGDVHSEVKLIVNAGTPSFEAFCVGGYTWAHNTGCSCCYKK